MCKYVVRQANSKQCIPEVVRVENPLISIAKNSIFCEDEKVIRSIRPCLLYSILARLVITFIYAAKTN